MATVSQSITTSQKELVERFLSAFNSIQKYLCFKTNSNNLVSFMKLVSTYEKMFPRWQDGKTLGNISNLRNAIVHSFTGEYLAVPTPAIVNELENIHHRLTNPEKVLPKFQREVVRFQYQEPMTNALKIIHDCNFSQFPIYQDIKFQGLLTENGITRWLASHTTKEISLIEFADVTIDKIIEIDENKTNYKFLPRNSLLMDAENAFIKNTALEAVIITEKGNSEETPLGIITRWDLLQLS